VVVCLYKKSKQYHWRPFCERQTTPFKPVALFVEIPDLPSPITTCVWIPKMNPSCVCCWRNPLRSICCCYELFSNSAYIVLWQRILLQGSIIIEFQQKTSGSVSIQAENIMRNLGGYRKDWKDIVVIELAELFFKCAFKISMRQAKKTKVNWKGSTSRVMENGPW
jgi:hypothetical protein